MTEIHKFSSPVNLRKSDVPSICVYGDDKDRTLNKLIWGLIPGLDVRIIQPLSVESLIDEANNSALIFIVVNNYSDANIEIAEKLSTMDGVVADVIAITSEPDIRARLHMLSAKYDAIYNLNIINQDDFRKIFLHKLKKGISRLNFRLQEDEYESFLGFLSVSADSFIVFDRHKRLFFASNQYLKLFPDKADILVRGTPVQKVFESIMDTANVSPNSQAFQDALLFWTRLQGEHEFQTTDRAHWRMTAVDLPAGQGTILSITNVTAYKEQERALADKQAELERALAAEQEASSLQKQFIGMVSHEFRTPLAIVDGNAQILERRYLEMNEADVKSRLRTIRSAVSRTLNMMQAVLSSNLLKTGKMDVMAEYFSLKDLIRELCREQSDLAQGYDIKIEVDNLPDQIWMDPKIITLVLTNLLGNAVKFSSQNPVIIIHADIINEYVAISIEDNGIGIPDAEIGRIFDRFYRASTANEVIGSGVGLSLVKDLVSIHGGDISVVSKVGVGSKFTVHIPYLSPALEQIKRKQ